MDALASLRGKDKLPSLLWKTDSTACTQLGLAVKSFNDLRLSGTLSQKSPKHTAMISIWVSSGSSQREETTQFYEQEQVGRID
jgi:hypothetical protein